jgi:hypothetical protein
MNTTLPKTAKQLPLALVALLNVRRVMADTERRIATHDADGAAMWSEYVLQTTKGSANMKEQADHLLALASGSRFQSSLASSARGEMTSLLRQEALLVGYVNNNELTDNPAEVLTQILDGDVLVRVKQEPTPHYVLTPTI